ncbi:MAG: TldD/PmbA family protein [Gemmatimonadaceae bacterium]|nr:TldD/PmbA family protein [Gemmatimonadaceae bacterium]
MDRSRREFLRTSSAAAAGAALVASGRLAQAQSAAARMARLGHGDPAAQATIAIALEAARAAGASYADARVSLSRTQNVFTRERRVQGLVDNETLGVGVRVLVDGAWGFAATSDLRADAVARVARQAVAQAKATRGAGRRPVTLAPTPGNQKGTWRSAIQVDPFTVPVEDKVALLLAANEAALKVPQARFVTSSMFFLKDEKTYGNTEGTLVEQTIFRAQPSVNVTAVSKDFRDFQTRQSNDIQPMGRGYEHVTEAKLVENAPRWADEAVQKLSAKPVEVGRYDLVLHPTHLWLTIHESVAHPTELDRAMGYEANYAGTSFVFPPEKVLGSLQFGSPLMNIDADRSQPGSLAACGWDDDGVVPERFDIVKDGVFVDYQTTREQALWLSDYYRKRGMPVRSHGCSYAQSWADVQFQRMPNVNLRPGTKDLSWDDLIAATDRGIAIIGDGSFSIDQQRFNAQFGGQLFYEIKGGKVVGMLKDVAYQIRTPDFWKALDMLGGPKSYQLGGAFGDGKGQPAQSNSVSHGCVPTRHKQINVINTGRQA